MKKIFKLNLITIIIDLVLLFGPHLLNITSRRLCNCEVGLNCVCSQPFSYYLGIVLTIVAILHFIVNLIIFIIGKFKNNQIIPPLSSK